MESLEAILKLIEKITVGDEEHISDEKYQELSAKIDQFRCQLIERGRGGGEIQESCPAVLDNPAIFCATFAFLFDCRRAVDFLRLVGGPTLEGDFDPRIIVNRAEESAEDGSNSEAEDESEVRFPVVLGFLQAGFRMSVIVESTLTYAKDAREQHLHYDVAEARLQEGLDRTLVGCVQFGNLLIKDHAGKHGQEARMMFAGFVMLISILLEASDEVKMGVEMAKRGLAAASAMKTTSEVVFQLADDIQDMIIDMRVDVGVPYLPEIFRKLAIEDPDLQLQVPFRMLWFCASVQLEQLRVGRTEQWRVKQQLDNANHYCADTARLLAGGRCAFASWMLYGLSLLDCELYDKAKVVLEMDHLLVTSGSPGTGPDSSLPSCRYRLSCLELAASKIAAEELNNDVESGGPNSEYLTYFSSAAEGDRNKETTVWDSIYTDPAVRVYSPRGEIPDYKALVERVLKETGSAAGHVETPVVQSVILTSVGPFIDLSYQLPKPPSSIRSDGVLLVYGGSVNEMLDVQSHLDACSLNSDSEVEVPDIDMMMAVPLSVIGLEAAVDTTDSMPGYVRLIDQSNKTFLPSFELLVDSFPIALNKVATFVADRSFADQYQIESLLIHGPAISTKLRRHNDSTLCYDHVPAFWIQHWPEFAQEWVNRERAHGWPSPADVARMTGDGVLLVAACHRSSRHPMDEWRVSFTQTERALIDTLSSVQRLSYLYAKLLWKAFLKPPLSFIASYHLKTALLWMCEGTAPDFWSPDKLVECIAGIFNWLRDEIGGFRRIRHYFIPANNMMSDVDPSLVTDSCVQNVVEKLDDLIANTFERVLEADAKLTHISVTRNLRLDELANDVLRDRSAADEGVEAATLTTLFEGLLRFSSQQSTDPQFKGHDEICARLQEAMNKTV